MRSSKLLCQVCYVDKVRRRRRSSLCSGKCWVMLLGDGCFCEREVRWGVGHNVVAFELQWVSEACEERRRYEPGWQWLDWRQIGRYSNNAYQLLTLLGKRTRLTWKYVVYLRDLAIALKFVC